jgi:hypothetical protein
LERHRERTGDDATIALPPPTLRPTIPCGDTSSAWQRYEVEQKMQLHEQHWNNEAIKATERGFPLQSKNKKINMTHFQSTTLFASF